MNKFKVSFTENKKYNPASRTIEVEIIGSAPEALFMIQQQFGKKKINITSVIDENGVDFLKPRSPEEIENDAINISADVDDIKVKFMPNGDVIVKNNDSERILELSKTTMEVVRPQSNDNIIEDAEITNNPLLMSSEELDEHIGEST